MKDNDIYDLCKKIQPIYRSITGKGNIETLKIFKKINPKLKILYFKSGKKVFDWEIPKVWSINDAWIKSIKSNKKIVSFKENFLSVMGYSRPINKIISNKELKKKIYTVKSQPNTTPYITSYYKKDWGFSMPENKKKKLQQVNLQKRRLWWEEGKKWVNIKISTKALKSIQKVGLDKFAKSNGVDLKKF